MLDERSLQSRVARLFTKRYAGKGVVFGKGFGHPRVAFGKGSYYARLKGH